MFVTASADCVPTSEPNAQSLLTRWAESAGTILDFPLTLDRAAELLRDGGEYDVDADELRRLGEMGQVPAVELWDARDVMAAAGCLEGRRQWRMTPSVHDPKKTTGRIGLESHLAVAAEGGLEQLATSLKAFDIRLALVLLCEAENRQLRERLLAIAEGLFALKGIRI